MGNPVNVVACLKNQFNVIAQNLFTVKERNKKKKTDKKSTIINSFVYYIPIFEMIIWLESKQTINATKLKR